MGSRSCFGLPEGCVAPLCLEVGAQLEGAPQDPVAGLVGAARAMARRGLRLQAGMILMCGTHLPVQAIGEAGAVRVYMGIFGSMSFSVV